MSIFDGRVIESGEGYIGYKSGSTGVTMVDGVGSTWTIGSRILVGNYGNGTLMISSKSVTSPAGSESKVKPPLFLASTVSRS